MLKVEKQKSAVQYFKYVTTAKKYSIKVDVKMNVSFFQEDDAT